MVVGTKKVYAQQNEQEGRELYFNFSEHMQRERDIVTTPVVRVSA